MKNDKAIRNKTDPELTKSLGAIQGAGCFSLIALVILIILVDGILFKLVAASFVGLLNVPILLERKKIKAELLRRHSGSTNTTPMLKSNKRTAIIVLIVGIAITAIFCGVILSIPGSGKGGCRNCGRDVPLVSGFGYCADCYEGFVDWQKDNWTEEK